MLLKNNFQYGHQNGLSSEKTKIDSELILLVYSLNAGASTISDRQYLIAPDSNLYVVDAY